MKGIALGPLHTVTTHLTIDRSAKRAVLRRNGRRQWSAPVGIGAPATPTPQPTKGPGTGPIITPPGGGGGGGGECTVLIFCKPGETPKATPEPEPAATQPPVPQQPPAP